MMSLAEELLLLALHEDKGKFLLSASTRVPYCIAGALLMELILNKRIDVQSKTLELIDRSPTGDPLLDSILDSIDTSSKTRTPHYWVSKIGHRFKANKKNLLGRLVDKGFLNKDEHRVLGIFPMEIYPMRDDRVKRETISHIRTLVLRREQPDLRSTMLISLIYTCALTDTLFEKDERKAARKQVKEIANTLEITKAITKAIQGAQAAVGLSSG